MIWVQSSQISNTLFLHPTTLTGKINSFSTELVFIRVDGKRFSHRHHAFCLLLHTKHLLTKHTAPPDKAFRATGAWFTGHCHVHHVFCASWHPGEKVYHPCLVDQEAEAWSCSCRARDGDAPELRGSCGGYGSLTPDGGRDCYHHSADVHGS